MAMPPPATPPPARRPNSPAPILTPPPARRATLTAPILTPPPARRATLTAPIVTPPAARRGPSPAGLTLSQASGWGFLFTYCAACAAVVAPEGLGLYAVALCSVLAGVTSSIAGADGGTVLGFVASSAGIGLLMLAMSDLRLRNEEL